MKRAGSRNVSWVTLGACCLVLLWPQVVQDIEQDGRLMILRALSDMVAPLAGIYLVDVLLQNMGVEKFSDSENRHGRRGAPDSLADHPSELGGRARLIP